MKGCGYPHYWFGLSRNTSRTLLSRIMVGPGWYVQWGPGWASNSAPEGSRCAKLSHWALQWNFVQPWPFSACSFLKVTLELVCLDKMGKMNSKSQDDNYFKPASQHSWSHLFVCGAAHFKDKIGFKGSVQICRSHDRMLCPFICTVYGLTTVVNFSKFAWRSGKLE